MDHLYTYKIHLPSEMECVLRCLLNATLICTVKTCKTFARTIHRCASDSSYSVHSIFGLGPVLLCIY